MILLNKSDLVPGRDLAQLETLIRHLNPEAKLIRRVRGQVGLRDTLNTRLLDPERAAASPGWMKEPRFQRESERDEYGIDSFVYHARRPFHPERLMRFLQQPMMRRVLRSKGDMWLATRPDLACRWHAAGQTMSIEPGGLWWASRPESEWPDDPEMIREVKVNWHDGVGDRRQEVFFTGLQMEQQAIIEALNEYLLTKDEMRLGDPMRMTWRPLSKIRTRMSGQKSMRELRNNLRRWLRGAALAATAGMVSNLGVCPCCSRPVCGFQFLALSLSTALVLMVTGACRHFLRRTNHGA